MLFDFSVFRVFFKIQILQQASFNLKKLKTIHNPLNVVKLIMSLPNIAAVYASYFYWGMNVRIATAVAENGI
jgi:hypothetical protein